MATLISMEKSKEKKNQNKLNKELLPKITFTDIQEMQQEKDLEKFIILEIIAEISYAREEKKITQKELSILSGVPQKTISRLENGKDLPKFSTLFKLLKALGLKMEINIVPRS